MRDNPFPRPRPTRYDRSLHSVENARLATDVAMSKADFLKQHNVLPNSVVIPEAMRYGSGLREILGLSVVYSRDVVRVHVGLFESKHN